MYSPPHFHETDPSEIADIIAAAPLATIVAETPDGIIANHIPLLSGPDNRLIGHIAKANRMHEIIQDGQDVLVIFQGVDGYISPNSYPSKAETHKAVPTWNYQVVHMRGPIRFQHDVAAKRAAVGLLTRTHERRVNGSDGWRMADAPEDYLQSMLDNIVALRIDVQHTLAKSKLSQNRDARDRAGVVDGLRTSGQTDLADRMAKREPSA